MLPPFPLPCNSDFGQSMSGIIDLIGNPLIINLYPILSDLPITCSIQVAVQVADFVTDCTMCSRSV